MITGFEKFTTELTSKEIKIAEIVAQALSKRIGKNKIVTNGQMCKGLLSKKGIKISEVRIRKIIHELRVKDKIKCLIATANGYYICNEIADLRVYVNSLQQRINSIEEIKTALNKQLNEFYQPSLL